MTTTPAEPEPSSARSPGPSSPADPSSPAEPSFPAEPSSPAGPSSSPRVSQGEAPLYKGEPLDGERGPGLGCFWVQVALLGILLVLTPLTVAWAWPAEVSAVLLLITLALLLFAGQTVIFLLRLVAADRRSRRVPRSATARRTVGMLEDEQVPAATATETVEGTATSDEDTGAGAPSHGHRPPTDRG